MVEVVGEEDVEARGPEERFEESADGAREGGHGVGFCGGPERVCVALLVVRVGTGGASKDETNGWSELECGRSRALQPPSGGGKHVPFFLCLWHMRDE